MDFIYTGIDKNSVKQRGKLEANSEKEVIDFLRQGSITPLSIRKLDASSSIFGKQKVSDADIIIFTRQLSSMTLTGLTLIESLKILDKQITSPAMKKIVTDLINQIS